LKTNTDYCREITYAGLHVAATGKVVAGCVGRGILCIIPLRLLIADGCTKAAPIVVATGDLLLRNLGVTEKKKKFSKYFVHFEIHTQQHSMYGDVVKF